MKEKERDIERVKEKDKKELENFREQDTERDGQKDRN